MESEDKIPDAATDYSLANFVFPPELAYPAFVSTLLEDAAIRHCLVGDVVAKCMGYPVLIANIFAAVDDPQLADAGAVLKAKGFVNYACTQFNKFNKTQKDTDDWPGFVFARSCNVDDPILVYVVPTSSWHHHLEPANYEKNTILLAQHHFRVPNKVHYMDGTFLFIHFNFLYLAFH